MDNLSDMNGEWENKGILGRTINFVLSRYLVLVQDLYDVEIL